MYKSHQNVPGLSEKLCTLWSIYVGHLRLVCEFEFVSTIKTYFTSVGKYNHVRP